jgi:isopentenyl diphosphate isomerase/L-lactate dehydrogenase-like FMN-dependent dehydrogenase
MAASLVLLCLSQESVDGPLFLNLHEAELVASRRMQKAHFEYYGGCSDDCVSAQSNERDWAKIRLLPRILKDVSFVTTSTILFGMNLSMPLLIAPMAMHGLADRRHGELATLRAAASAGVPFSLSTMSTRSIEDVSAEASQLANANVLFQLYVIKDRGLVKQWVESAERGGFKALLVTVDAPILGKREKDVRNRFSLPPDLELSNLRGLNRSTGLGGMEGSRHDDGSTLMRLFATEIDSSLTWSFIPWLKKITRLPIVLKGILSPLDAKLAMKHQISGIVISNHGGRQLDGVPSAIEMLPEIVKAVEAVRGSRMTLLVDGGVRRGTDVLKALALGADGVLLGRPVLWGLAADGERGVSRVLGIIREEFSNAMALAGVNRVEDITSELIRQ